MFLLHTIQQDRSDGEKDRGFVLNAFYRSGLEKIMAGFSRRTRIRGMIQDE